MGKKTAISWIGWIVICSCALAATADVNVAPPSRDFLSTEAGGRIWIARAQQGAGDLVRYTLTDIASRVRFGQWTESPQILGRVVSMAGADGELLVVLQNGQMQIVDDTSVRSGIPLPGDAMLAVADGQQSVWAIIEGMQRLTTAPDSDQEPSTQSDSEAGRAINDLVDAATLPATEPTTRTVPLPLYVWRLSAGKWLNSVLLPSVVAHDPQRFSMTVVDGLPMIAWRVSDNAIRVIRLRKDNSWSGPTEISVAAAEDFKLLNLQGAPAIWLGSVFSAPAGAAPSNQSAAATWSAGDLLSGRDFSEIEPLQILGARPPNIVAQTFLPALDRLRWLGCDNAGNISEETFDMRGKAVASAPIAERRPDPAPFGPWAAAGALMVVMSAAAATRTRQVPLVDAEGTTEKAILKLRLAPLRLRLAAGMVDLIPLFAVAALIKPGTMASPLGGIDPKSLQPLFELAVLTYLLHVTIAELICGQSVGKMVFGLRVVTAQGKDPGWISIMVRNALRVADLALLGLPLILIAVLPLHQRVGDIVAGTVVVSMESGDEDAGG